MNIELELFKMALEVFAFLIPYMMALLIIGIIIQANKNKIIKKIKNKEELTHFDSLFVKKSEVEKILLLRDNENK
ncbi:hypothetical protein ALC152_05280 [Arcobacter sp. 15-2]|uniref:hypothetical protein n=1 Tax=Arcobacter sp. 15-2 TaxID=3374109 RepID=UPI00399CB2E3